MKGKVEIEKCADAVLLRFKGKNGAEYIGVFDNVGELRSFKNLLGKKLTEFIIKNGIL